MFGLFKSRKKQQEEEARRRESERAEAASEQEQPEAGVAEDREGDVEDERSTGAGEPQPLAGQGGSSVAGEADSGSADTSPSQESAASSTVATAAPATASAVETESPDRPVPVDYQPSPVETTAAEESLGRQSLGQESPQSALQEYPADGTREADLATDVTPAPSAETAAEPSPPAPKEKPKGGWLSRVRAGLGRTRANLTDGIADLLLGKKQIDDELMEDLETQLLLADVGIEATSEIIERLTGRVSRKELADADALYRALQEELAALLEPVSQPLQLPAKGEGPFVILMVGVNGVGKTTTIGKLTQRFQNEGRSVMLAAGDTFRAAAVEQLKVWGERNRVPVIAQHTGADSASVIYDAVAAARARKVDVLIADTAGRLHNKSHLMEELKKVQRVMAKLDASAPHEVMLVLDAGTGQNAISQATTFDEAIPVTGITLTKVDGTAKGGIIFALAKKMGTPIRFIGVGESLEDLRPFDAQTFVKALFGRDGDADS
ncbi:signal recognition particle-docking protein FtsY [Salinicola acroporae]|uniref:Signal recognition particle receptor FtsY n=1 Tax=Salinicola acroporae TaxID=1541440 RepID=A0ABT6I963_9GAMM|nr:signal recognition particle-docking protein FtsY [Salinicola acroporae]MDH4574264.1 signal recognition particle-docking protein FtsY [Salinicola acroporae]